MIILAILWLILVFLSIGIPGLIFLSMKKASKRSWKLRINRSYRPKVSILVPTYNESKTIHFKLRNLKKIEYPQELTQIIVVDSESSDNTISVTNTFSKQHKMNNIETLVETAEKGKSAALNLALKHCKGEIVIVSDADCFWPSDILIKTLPFLSNPDVGAISGPKSLLNPEQSWIARTEQSYLDAMNTMKLGESKIYSTLFFEGGFGAYKRELLESFDPYNTGSDDCGTIITLAEKKSRAIMIPEARFFTIFPTRWREKLRIKARRANQIIRVLGMYIKLLTSRRIKSPKRVIANGIFIYLISPVFFVFLLVATLQLMLSFPYIVFFSFIFLIPKLGYYLFEVFQSNLLLFFSLLSLAFNKKFVIWSKPESRSLLTEDVLNQHDLI